MTHRSFSVVLARVLAVALTLSLAATAEGCRKKGRGGRHAAGKSGALPQPEPTPAPTDPTPTPAPPSNPDVGVDEPVIEPDTVSTIDTTKEARLSHLVFQTTSAQEAGRYLSEYMIVVRAREESCVRLKTRPTGGLTQEVDDALLTDAEKGHGACAGQKLAGEATSDQQKADEKKDDGTTQAGGDKTALRQALLQYPEDGKLKADRIAQRGFSLAGQTAALCSPRLFRMESDGLEKVVSKTGRLMHVGSRVRVWLDEEFANVCTGGVGLDARSPIAFGPLIQNNSDFNPTVRDKLWLAQLQTLASEMDKIVDRMTAVYGPLSDIDSSGYAEIFLSPDVNRKYFVKFPTYARDQFRANLIFRPEDLAYYNAETNPTSNEGEIFYMWVPDPAGIYNYMQFPSSNSITMNYAKGYLAAQAMTLIIANQRLFVQKQSQMEERWLVEPLSLLAASYYAGNDYPVTPLAQFLTSRTQYLSLTGGLEESLLSEPYKAIGQDEIVGLRTLFGWYVHSRLCGANVAPCAKLTSLIQSTKTGRDNLEAVLGEPLEKTLENFALSLGVELLDHPEIARAFWSQTPAPAGLPPAPVDLPELTEIYSSDPPKTAEETYLGALSTDDPVDRTVAGPFPTKEGLIFQVITSDNDMEFKLAKDSVALILVTGLIDQRTDVTALFGKGLNVVFVPIGERDNDMRRVHVEKVSEEAHSDLRPDNLSSQTDPDTTYAYPPTYDTLDYSVTPTRDLWVLGSIDNYTLNVVGADAATGDSDAYEVEVRPCEGVPAADLAACQAKDHELLVQVAVRDFEKELAPMLLVTDTDRGIFRGHSVYGRLKDLLPSLTEDESVAHRKTFLCKATLATTSIPVTFTNGTPGIGTTATAHNLTTGDKVQFTAGAVALPSGILPRIDYVVTVTSTTSFTLADVDGNDVTVAGATADAHGLHSGDRDTCANGGIPGAFVYDHNITKADSTGFAHTYDDYLALGPLGFPFTNQPSISYLDMPACPGFRCYQKIEWAHSHLFFKMSPQTEANNYYYYAVPSFPNGTALSDDEIDALYSVKTRIDACPSIPDPQTDTFTEECQSLSGMTETECRFLCTNKVRVDLMQRTRLSASQAIIVCPYGSVCTHQEALIRPGANSAAWIDPTRYFWYQQTGYSKQTYYPAIEPASRDSYCGGEPGHSSTTLTRCDLRHDAVHEVDDIRQQLNVEVKEFAYGFESCRAARLGVKTKVCIDPLSVDREFLPEDVYKYAFFGLKQPTDRERLGYPAWTSTVTGSHPKEDLPYDITFRAGEVIAKPERIQSTLVKVGGTGKILNVIIGGRGQSQGKYLLRVQMRKFD